MFRKLCFELTTRRPWSRVIGRVEGLEVKVNQDMQWYMEAYRGIPRLCRAVKGHIGVCSSIQGHGLLPCSLIAESFLLLTGMGP